MVSARVTARSSGLTRTHSRYVLFIHSHYAVLPCSFPDSQGNWKRDRWHGLGRLTCHSGLIYVGHFDKNTFHGVGKLSLPNGMTYEGDSSNLLLWISTLGQFERGLRHGKGKLTYSDGSTYIGTFDGGCV